MTENKTLRQINHERLARIESMLIFLMEKQALEMNRKPLPSEKIEGVTSRVLYRRTFFEEWREAWEKKLNERKVVDEGNGQE